MRIGIDATCLPSAPAGAGRYILGLISGLMKLDTSHEFIIFIKESDRKRFEGVRHPQMTFVAVPYSIRPTRLFWEAARTPGVIRHFNLDVWHASHYITPLTTSDCKVVVTFHDMAFYIFPELYPITKRWLFRWALNRSAQTADRIIATSQATKDEISQILHLEPHGISVIHHGIDPAFRPVKESKNSGLMLQGYGISVPYILAVATLDRRKNLQTLVRAYHHLVETQNIPEVLVIAGQEGNDSQSLRRTIVTLNLVDRVRLIGYVPEEDLPELYRRARLFVSPSRYEGFGFPALEALACGTPVLTSPSPSVLETSNRAQVVSALFSMEAWSNQMARLLAQSNDQNHFPNDPNQWADRFTWEDVARLTVEVYEDAAEGEVPAADGPKWPLPGNHHPEILPDACTYAVLRTVIYGDIFDYPLSAREIHRGLIGFRASQEQVNAALQSPELSNMIVAHNGWYMLKGREDLGLERTKRAQDSARLFQKNHRLLQWLCAWPFVRMLSLSGAIAFENCHGKSDIDLFMVVEGRRIWSTYILLAGLAKLLGKRDLFCMNYLIGRSDQYIEDQDFYIAHQIANLQPLYNWPHYRRFTTSNHWVMDYLPQWNGHSADRQRFGEIRLTKPMTCLKKISEWILRLPIFNPIEWLVFRVYGSHLIRKVSKRTNSDVRLTRDRIKLHTNDHSFRVMNKFERRVADVLRENGRMNKFSKQQISAN